jgi:protein-S-isoprenylcysteine O-methyltransferase Ste14
VALRIACACLAAGTYLTFIWGVWKVFVRRGNPSGGLRVLQVAALASGIAEVAAIAAADDVGKLNAAGGSALYVFSLVLFVACTQANRARPLSLAFSPDDPTFLVRGGPYRWVRHPFYAAYLTSYVAGLVISGNQWLWIVVITMTAIYIWAARAEEEKFRRSQLAIDYDRYRRTTGMLVPSPIKWLRARAR